MKKTKPQTEVILKAFLEGKTLNLSSAYKLTKKHCKCACMKLSTRVSDTFIPLGFKFIQERQGQYINYSLDIKKTSKKLINQYN
jgi:hypothetical protein